MTQGEELFSTQHVLLDNTDARRCFFQQCVHRRSAGSKQKESTAGDRNLWSDASEDQPCRQGSRVGSQPSSSSRSERRTQYVPRMGSLTYNVEHIDPHYVAKALSMVQKDLKGVKPHYKLMKVAVEKIESDERYYQMVLGALEMTPVPKSPTRHQMFTPPRRSMHNSEE